MKKIIKLTESDLINIVKRVIKEQSYEFDDTVIVPELIKYVKNKKITFYKSNLEDKELKQGESDLNFFGKSKSKYLEGTILSATYRPKNQVISFVITATGYNDATSGLEERPKVSFSCKTKTFTETDYFSGDETIYNKELGNWLINNVCNKYQNRKFGLPPIN